MDELQIRDAAAAFLGAVVVQPRIHAFVITVHAEIV